MNQKNKDIKLWLMVEKGLTGTTNQLKAVDARLRHKISDLKTETQYLERGSWNWLTFNSCKNDKPDLILAAGRLAIVPSLYFKLKGIKVAFLQDPRFGRFIFDRIYAPFHDPAHGSNVIKTDGTITPIQKCGDNSAKDTVFLIIGGARKGVEGMLDLSFIDSLKGKKVLGTFSRRTPQALKDNLLKALPNAAWYDPNDNGDNPYRRWLCEAEIILATNDSTAMISDAASTGRSVYVLPYIQAGKRFQRFYDHLLDSGAIKMFEGDISRFNPTIILNDADKVASDIAQHFFDA